MCFLLQSFPNRYLGLRRFKLEMWVGVISRYMVISATLRSPLPQRGGGVQDARGGLIQILCGLWHVARDWEVCAQWK